MHTKRGFTVVELLVTLAVFGVIMLAGTSFLINTISGANQAKIQNDVRQNANVILQDITHQMRSASCRYYIYPDATDANSVKLRLSDDPSTPDCSTGNRVEYRQDPSDGFWQVSKRTTALGALPDPNGWQIISSNAVAIADCSDPVAGPCGKTVSCLPGINYNSANGQVIIRAQQPLSQVRVDFCASVTLTDTVVPRTR